MVAKFWNFFHYMSLRGIRIVGYIIMFGASTLRYPLGVGNDSNEGGMHSYRIRLFLCQKITNLGIYEELNT